MVSNSAGDLAWSRDVHGSTKPRSAAPRSPTKVEQGDPAVSLGIYAAVLFSLGLIDRLATLADPGLVAVGLQLEQEQLPQRIVLTRARLNAVGEGSR